MDISFSKEKITQLLFLFALCYSAVYVSHRLQFQMKGESHASLNIEAFTRQTVTQEYEEEPLRYGADYSTVKIMRVPGLIRKKREDAYTPQVVSVGPYHHGQQGLRTMDEYKRRYLQHFLMRSNHRKDAFLRLIQEEEQVLRNHYSEPILMSSIELTEMVLKDAAFILELFYRVNFDFINKRLPSINESFPTTRYMVSLIRNDILMLENQLPFFILENLLGFANIRAPSKTSLFEKNEKLSLIKLTYSFYRNRRTFRVQFEKLESLTSIHCYHFLDFLRHFHLPPHDQNGENRLNDNLEVDFNRSKNKENMLEDTEMQFNEVPTVTELQQVGVHFRDATSKNLFDVKFNRKKGVLYIPRFYLIEDTEVLFRNMIIFEQFCYPGREHVTDYMRFLGILVKTPEDLEILVRSGSFENRVGDYKAASKLINTLQEGTYIRTTKFYFIDICKQLMSYYNDPWHGFVATLKQDYFNTPWAAIVAAAGAMSLICSLLQTVFTIINKRN